MDIFQLPYFMTDDYRGYNWGSIKTSMNVITANTMVILTDNNDDNYQQPFNYISEIWDIILKPHNQTGFI